MVKRKDEKIVTFDYDELSGYSDTVCELIPLSQREISILVSCLRVAGWTARWFGGDKLLREIGRFTDLENALTYIESLERKLLTVGCLEGLIDVMSEIRDAIRAQANCCAQVNNPYSMVDIGGGQLAYGTQQPLTEPPEGEFENENAYLSHRCEAANVIVADLVSAYNQFGTVGFIVGGILLGIVLVTAPPVALLLALAMSGFIWASCVLVSNYIDTHRQELVCMLYNSESYADWEIAYADWVETLTIELELGEFKVDLTRLFRSFVSTDAYNKMFTNILFPVADDPVDCDVCEEEDEFTIDMLWGEYDPQTGILTSFEQYTGVHYIQGSIDPQATARWSTMTNWSDTEYNDNFNLYAYADYQNKIYESKDQVPGEYAVGSFLFVSSTSWSIKVELSEV